MSTAIIEEKTPKGYTLKINIAKRQYVVFTPKGELIYADSDKSKPFHTMKVIAFIDVKPALTKAQSFGIFKVQNGSIIIPYTIKDERQYLFLPTESSLDSIPFAIEYFNDISSFVGFIKKDTTPDYIIINESLGDNDKQIITSLCPSSHIETVTTGKKPLEDSKRAVDQISTADINLLSQNPVFLARIHLRNLDLTRVKQILLDMDLTETDTQYIIAFLTTMIKNSEKEELSKYTEKLTELKKAYEFYLHLIKRNDETIKEFINHADKNDLITFQTLIQKAKLLFPTKEESLRFVDYENYIWEKQQ